MDYKAWFALAEFVDNSIQSWLEAVKAGSLDTKSSPLEISIYAESGSDGYILIRDNAAGIPLSRFETAFEIGSPPPDTSGLSVYGIGMKSAGAWFAERFTISTTAIGDSVNRRVEYDFPTIVKEGLEELAFTESRAVVGDHGTEIRLSSIRNPIHTRTHEKVRSHLTSIYRHFIRDGQLRLFYQGERLEYREAEILRASDARNLTGGMAEWRKDIHLELSTGERVDGFAAIRKIGRAAGSGFSLYRKGRVITGLDDDPWRPTEIFGYGNSYRSQRLFGELHLENVKVAYSKNGFVWQGASQEELIEKLRSALDTEPLPLLRQAENYRAREPEPRQRQAAQRAARSTTAAMRNAVARDLPERLNKITMPEGASTSGQQRAVNVFDERTLELTLGGMRWLISTQVDDEDDGDWLAIRDTGALRSGETHRTLGIRININNAFMRQFAGNDPRDAEAIFRIGAAIALALVVDRERGIPIATILDHINQLLRGSLAR